MRKLEGVNIFNIPELDISPVTLKASQLILNETKEFNAGQPVTIKPGTTIYLGSQVSLIFKGPLTIEGTKDLPVRIRPLDDTKPFGVVALLGEKAKGSRIDYLDIEGGSVHNRYNLEFTGMLSIHDNPDIKIFNSRFGQNFLGDDAVHFVRSKVKIDNCVFEDAQSDAIDFDLVDGEIRNSVFRNTGNDGLDISMGTVLVADSQFEKSGDKCISVGEGAQTTIVGSKFRQCNVGIAVKDRSKVALTNSLFLENNIAYNTYRKKWRWEMGGEGVLLNTYFKNSTSVDIKGDKFSKVSFIGSTPKKLRSEGKFQLIENLKG